MTAMRIGVLAVQGGFAEHIDVLREIGAEGVPVRLPRDLEHVSGMIMPGGESTTMRKPVLAYRATVKRRRGSRWT
jgi:5'-phosphate synthase pdxT subunit